MKTIISKSLVIFFFLLIGTSHIYGMDEYSRVIKKEFAVNSDAQLIINNKYGKVHCNNWEKSSVSLEIVLKVEASNEKTAQKLLDKILISISNSPQLIEAKTTLEDGFSGRSKVEIDYTINMPSSISLDLTNKFGDVYINELNGKGKLNLSYGDIEVNSLGNSDNLIDLKFGKAEIRSIKGAVVLIKYSELKINYAGSLRVDSKYSDIFAQKIISLNINSEGGKLELENSSAVESKSKFSDMEIGRIDKNLTLEIQYGNCDVQIMPSDFSSISIKNKYANVSISIPTGTSYILEANLKFCDLDFPEDDVDFSQKIIHNSSKAYRGTIGKGKNIQSRITVQSEFGNVSLK